MVKYVVAVTLIVLSLLGIAGYFLFFSSATAFSGTSKIVYIPKKTSTTHEVVDILLQDSILSNPWAFTWLSKKMNYWDHVKSGRYKVPSGRSVFSLIRMLRNGQQEPTRLVINHLRLPEDFARLLGKNIEADSTSIMKLLEQTDSTKYKNLNTRNWSANIIPNTYELFWTWPPEKVFDLLIAEHTKWWERDGRIEKAAAKGLTPQEVHIIASIIEEETNKKSERPLVASVYLNRLEKGMPLQADPTIRFSLKDFKMNRIYHKHLQIASPYNTYLNRGLPPGPIGTASTSSLEAVLNAPETDYIFFVADPDLQGGHTFTTNLSDHTKAAKLYTEALTEWQKRKAAKEVANGQGVNK